MNRKTIPLFQAVALMEALVGLRPGKEQALAILDDMRKDVAAENIKEMQATVQHARENMSDEEWSLWTD